MGASGMSCEQVRNWHLQQGQNLLVVRTWSCLRAAREGITSPYPQLQVVFSICIITCLHSGSSDDMLTRCLANFLGWMCVYPVAQGIATDSRCREVLLGQGHIILLASPTLNCIPQRHVRHKFACALNMNIITFLTKWYPQPFHMSFYICYVEDIFS